MPADGSAVFNKRFAKCPRLLAIGCHQQTLCPLYILYLPFCIIQDYRASQGSRQYPTTTMPPHLQQTFNFPQPHHKSSFRCERESQYREGRVEIGLYWWSVQSYPFQLPVCNDHARK